MSLFNDATFILIPSGIKAGKVYSEKPVNGNGDLTWSRNSLASRTTSSGLIQSVSNNVPRRDYSQGGCPTFLLEPQRTNLVVRSEEFDNASWSKNGSLITANSTNAPNSTLTADSLIEDTTTGLHFITATITVVTNTTYTGTIYIKANTRTKGRFRLNDTGGQPATDGNFDLTAETISSGTITNVGGGWYRLSLTRLMGSTSGSIVLFLADSTGSISYAGNGSSGLYIWGAQLEAGSYATTYIPTTTATATRLADTFTRNNIYTNGLISVNGGTWYVELRNNIPLIKDTISRFGIGDTSALNSNSLVISNLLTTSSRFILYKVIAGNYFAIFTSNADTTKLAIKWNGTTADVFVNGTKVVSATAFTTTNMEFLNCLSGDVPKFIQTMALFNEPKSDVDCEVMTGTSYNSYSAMATALGYTVI